MNPGCYMNLGYIRDLSGIYAGYFQDLSISQINPGYIPNIFGIYSQIYLGFQGWGVPLPTPFTSYTKTA
jgi:hypothetical protein